MIRSIVRLTRLVPVLLVAALLAVVAHSSGAAAASSQDITVTPSSTELSVAPGESATRKFTVINSGNDGYVVDASISPYHVEGEDYDPQFTRLPGTTSPISWLDLQTTQTTVKAGKSTSIDYTLTVPKNTAPGGYYAVLFAQTSPLTNAGNGVVPHNRVGNILYITVKGPVKNGGSLEAAPLSHLLLQTTVPVGVKVNNNGGVHFISTTTTDIKNMFGQSVYHSSLERFVLPQTTRLITADWKSSAPIGLYKVSRSATVAGATKTLPDRWVVVVHPWFVGLLVVLLVLILLYVAIKRRSKRTKGTVKK